MNTSKFTIKRKVSTKKKLVKSEGADRGAKT